MSTHHRYLGLMTGTSVDAIDVALIEVADNTASQPRILSGAEFPIDPALRTELRSLAVPGHNEIDRLGQADHSLGEALAEATLAFIDAEKIDRSTIRAIGSHGQTVRHRPDLDRRFTLQIGDPNRIAGRTGIDTVADFRRADVAAGGQGAPLVPLFHQELFASSDACVVLNVGGIANITVLPEHGSSDGDLLGFDTGPGNALMDLWCERHQDQHFDADGAWAQQGTVNQPLLRELLSDGFFEREPPKSTGREAFTVEWLERRLAGYDLSAQDIQATLCELTAAAAGQAINRWAAIASRCVVAGGGRRNSYLMSRLQHHTNIAVEPCESLGVDGDLLEAAAFGWLAHRHLSGLPGAASTTTGAAQPAVLGGLYPGSWARQAPG